MSVYNWALKFKYLMDFIALFTQIEILPGSGVTVMDAIIWGIIIFIVVKALDSVYH